jgi:hypothetical protein
MQNNRRRCMDASVCENILTRVGQLSGTIPSSCNL